MTIFNKVNLICRFLLSLTFVAFGISTVAQHFPMKQYMTSDGMPSNTVFDIAQHPSGMMWFMTKKGPVYYNTKSWQSFPDSLDLPSSSHSKIVVHEDTIWVAGMNKSAFTIQYFTDSKWYEIKTPFRDDFKNFNIVFNVASIKNQQKILLGLYDQLHVYDIKLQDWTEYSAQGSTINAIRYIDEELIIATSNGLKEFENRIFKSYPLPYDDLPNNNILNFIHRNKTLYLLGYDWYAEIKNGQLTYLINGIGLSAESLATPSSLEIDQTGNVFYASASPARMIDKEKHTWSNVLMNGKDINIGCTEILTDKENNIWVSSTRGLYKFNVLQFINYDKSSGLARDEVTAVTQLLDSTIILTNPFHVNTLKNNRINKYSTDNNRDGVYRISDIEESSNGNIYMTNYDGGLMIYDKRDLRNLKTNITIEGSRFTSVEKFRGNLYAATNKEVYRLENEKLIESHPFGGVRNLKNLGKSLAIMSSSSGVTLYDGTTFKNYKSDNLDINNVFQAASYHGEIILATLDGIATIEDGRIKPWKNVQIESPVYALLVDSKSRLWIGSDHGIYLYDNEMLTQYDVNEGLSGSEINRNALYEDFQGRIWIGTEAGVSIYKENADLKKNINLNVVISDIRTSQNERLSSYSNVTLPYDINNLLISFYCLSYSDENKMNFRYRLNKENDKWIELTTSKNAIALSNIEQGDYRFEIQARYDFGEWGPTSSFDFKIQNPYYLQWWFIIISIVIGLIIARTIFYFRYVFLIRKQKKLKEIVTARTQEIRLLNEKLEEKVRERTRELNEKNQRLEEYAYVNAHYLRGPLTKIMSVLQIMDANDTNEIDEKFTDILKESVKELDDVIYSINDILKE